MGVNGFRLCKRDLDIWESSLCKNLFDERSSGNGVVIEQGAGLHTDGDEGAERLCLPGVGIGKGIDRRPLDV